MQWSFPKKKVGAVHIKCRDSWINMISALLCSFCEQQEVILELIWDKFLDNASCYKLIKYIISSDSHNVVQPRIGPLNADWFCWTWLIWLMLIEIDAIREIRLLIDFYFHLICSLIMCLSSFHVWCNLGKPF